MDPLGLVGATERLYRSLFAGALALLVVVSVWGIAIAPFNDFNDHLGLSLALGCFAVLGAALAFARRRQLFGTMRRQPAWLLAGIAIAIALIWADGGWRSSYYLASYGPLLVAAVVGGLRWTLVCAFVLVAGYLGGLVVNGYSWGELEDLKDADSVVANSGGYLIAAFLFALPVSWLGGYVARINQIVGDVAQPENAERTRVTDSLTYREIEVAQLVAGGFKDKEIAEYLFLSPRTVQDHVRRAVEKTGTRNRTAMAVQAVLDGLAPAQHLDDESDAEN
ncbi:MAG TPA: helix-turn-helix transcriptional regulator [Solirubrobacterales bacterium]|nr:helix-turn-helix transcriptional regulator [Solirubrobacterales bacterium]